MMRNLPAFAIAASLLAAIVALSLAGTVLAEGPGSQLRATPEIPQATPMPTNPIRPEQKRCEALPTEQRQQCLANLRAAPTPRPNGPESIGGGAGAATGAGSGTTGGATFGGSAPR
jgi:hypothetical protein